MTSAELSGLHEALACERRAWATCDRLLKASGGEGPFVIIWNSEQRRLRALEALFERHGAPVPPSSQPDEPELARSCEATCAEALACEEAKDELYERLLDEATKVDLATMYRQLQRAARDVHAPAFRRCLKPGRPRRARCG